MYKWKNWKVVGKQGATKCSLLFRNVPLNLIGEYKVRDGGRTGDKPHPSNLPLFRGCYLPAFLFMAVLTQALFAFVGVHFFALSFFS